MKSTLRVWCLLVLIAAASTTVSANTITLTMVNGGSHTMGGVYVGPYNLTETIGSKTTPIKLVCDDFKDNVFAGEHWNVLTSTFNTLTNVKWSGQLKKYEEVGWLVEQMFDPKNSGNTHTVALLQWAIWDIFDPAVSSHDPDGSISKTDQSSINNWLAMAQTNYASGNYSNLTIYTPIPNSQVPFKSGPPQEYFGWNPVTPTPEPATLLLFGSGMFGIAGLRRRFASKA